ncbi:DUF305 domain-containing protein [Candidatus Woesebacteria bacterium]|nr:DUF305 domain-containing protein [Candidatus Woesebacteria bacterium]MCD8526964.1 DUF305 domain-containing protein [Candidatus Woesebacteria bacterium]
MKVTNLTRLLIMVGIHFVLMYGLMYVMVDTWQHVHLNINKFYMAGIMTAPMIPVSGLLMHGMYESKKILYGLMAVSVVGVISLFLVIREQAGVYDTEFLRSMIPHHSSAILMCERATIQDAEIRELCQEIVITQEEEIDQMEAILERMNE